MENQWFLGILVLKHIRALSSSTCRGLGLERILVNFLKVYCDPGNLVLVLNTNTIDEVTVHKP